MKVPFDQTLVRNLQQSNVRAFEGSFDADVNDHKCAEVVRSNLGIKLRVYLVRPKLPP